MSDVQVRGCCCGVPFGCGTVFLLVGCLFLWKLATPEVFGELASTALYTALAVSAAGLGLLVRIRPALQDRSPESRSPFDVDP